MRKKIGKLEVEAQLEAAKAYTQILHERTGDTSSSLVSVTTDDMARSIINRARQIEEQTRRKKQPWEQTQHIQQPTQWKHNHCIQHPK